MQAFHAPGARRSRSWRVAAVTLALWAAAGLATAAPCGSPLNAKPALEPRLPSLVDFSASDAAVDCAMWQTFIYLNWPALAGARGQPDPVAPFGAAKPTVWESFKSFDEVYLPEGQAPPPWSDGSLLRARALERGLATPRPRAIPAQRLLQSTRKVFRRPNPGEAHLDEIHQVDRGVLYDQDSQPVYYEMLMNRTSFDYVVGNKLYDATAQYAYASSTGIVLPTGAIEVKAAWKVLTPRELSARPRRFHTAQALLPDRLAPVTMGLVGLHIFMMPSADFSQGFWATFQQVDNAPTVSGPATGTYSFYNAACKEPCPPNVASSSPVPTQVLQMFPPSKSANEATTYVAKLIVATDPQSPWQFYQLIATQWPTSPSRFGTPDSKGNMPPIPTGTPNVLTLINPTLETFLQKSRVSCIGCHSGAAAAGAGPGRPPLQSSLSFLFGHASSAASAASSAAPSPRR